LTLIVDTSVALKWYASEDQTEQADAVLRHELAAPDLIVAEICNALLKKVLRREMDERAVGDVLPHLRRSIHLLPTAPLAEVALQIALELRHPAYDCFFLAAAEQLDLELTTADARLVRACRDTRHEARVRLL